MMKILHVEDDDDIREVAKMALEFSGKFEVMQCASGDEALEKAAGFAPDIILIDVMMPGRSGPSTLRELRKTDQMAEIPAIFMTARVQPAEVEALKAESAIAVIRKPFDAITLGDQIMDCLKAEAQA